MQIVSTLAYVSAVNIPWPSYWMLCQVEIFLLLLCAYAILNDISFFAPGSAIDILLSVVLIILTGGLFLFFFFCLLRFLSALFSEGRCLATRAFTVATWSR